MLRCSTEIHNPPVWEGKIKIPRIGIFPSIPADYVPTMPQVLDGKISTPRHNMKRYMEKHGSTAMIDNSFSVIFHYFVVELMPLIPLVCYVIFNLRYK